MLSKYIKPKMKDITGKKYVDAKLCTQCGECGRVCTYGAVVFKKIKLLLTSLNAGIAGHVLTTAHSRQYIQKMLRELHSTEDHVNNWL